MSLLSYIKQLNDFDQTKLIDAVNKWSGDYYSGVKNRLQNPGDALFQGLAQEMPKLDEQGNISNLGFGMGGLAGTIAGQKALKADRGALKKAQQMKADGADVDDIYAQTKWWLEHPDKQPRFEIDDSTAKLAFGGRNDPGYTGTFENYLKHPELYENYPQVGQRQTYSTRGEGASYDPRGGDYGEPTINIGREGDKVSSALHEGAGHGVQHLEGFARGGSPSEFLDPSKRGVAYGSENIDAMLSYLQLAGEVESRLIQKRQNMSLAERLENPFYKDYEIKFKDMILKDWE